MAGIGFELKKLFSKNGIILKIRANLYASLVIAGPMILGSLLLLGAKFVSSLGGASNHQQDLIVVLITYSLLFSLILSSTLLLVLARFIADKMYEGKYKEILPSMYGSLTILLSMGSVLWGIFLYLSHANFEYSVYSFILFCEGVTVWIQISYVTAIKEYRSTLMGFFIGITIGLLTGLILVLNNNDVVSSLLLGACVAYGILIVVFTEVLHKHFPLGEGNPFQFLRWLDEYPHLFFIGLFSTLSLFAHIVLMWLSPWGVKVEGLFYHAPAHDIPALLAFVTSLVTTVNFVTSVEVNFYPKYRLYFSLLNGDGSLSNVEKAHHDMVEKLRQELFYLAMQQIFVTVIAIVVFGELLVYLPLGMTSIMIGTFRVLCIGYGAYAIGNSLMLFLLYFANNRDALISVIPFFIINVLGTLYTITLPESFYGFGFVAAGIVYNIIAEILLFRYTGRLDYFVFTKQPVFFAKKKGFFTRITS